MTDLNTLIQKLPKAELHLHIEGSLEPELLVKLAQRNDINLPFKSLDEVRAAYRFSRLQDFLDIYYQGMAVLCTEQDFFELTTAYLDRVAADNVRHVEIFFDPQGHTERGIAFDTAIAGIVRGLEHGKEIHGISYRLIMCFLRHLTEKQAFATLKQAEPWLHRIDGVGLDSSEIGHPPSKFERVFKAAGQLGLHRVAHAGEEGPPEYVREALELLQVERIDHGNRALESSELIQQIRDSNITLTVCPLSNLSLCVVNTLQGHPIKTMLEQGLSATINSDDPAYFGGYINENFRQTAAACGLTRDEVVALAKNSFTGSFLSANEQQEHLRAIDCLVASV